MMFILYTQMSESNIEQIEIRKSKLIEMVESTLSMVINDNSL